jgi:uncharacterized RDD family membrane protein YckC
MENIAPLWKRVLALLVDVVACVLIIVFLNFFMPDIRAVRKVNVLAKVISALMLTSSFFYFVIMEALKGQTLGKMLLRIKAVAFDGQPMGWGKALGRNAMRYVDGIFMIGYLFAFFGKSKRRLGDLAAGTCVVNVPPSEKKKVADAAADTTAAVAKS